MPRNSSGDRDPDRDRTGQRTVRDSASSAVYTVTAGHSGDSDNDARRSAGYAGRSRLHRYRPETRTTVPSGSETPLWERVAGRTAHRDSNAHDPDDKPLA
jgi:hypothetical protein